MASFTPRPSTFLKKMSRYLDVDKILSEEERLPCLFLYDAANMGHLDSTIQQTTDLLPVESRVDLPFWLGQDLKAKNYVRIESPKFYGLKMRDALRAGAESINLREFSYYYFEVGMRLAIELSESGGGIDLLRNLRQAFVGERYRKILVRVLSQGTQDDLADFGQTLTSSEMSIFRAGLQATQNVQAWRRQESALLKSSNILGSRRGIGASDQAQSRKKTRG